MRSRLIGGGERARPAETAHRAIPTGPLFREARYLLAELDALKDNRTKFRIAEPLVTLYHAVMWPIWSTRAGQDGSIVLVSAADLYRRG